MQVKIEWMGSPDGILEFSMSGKGATFVRTHVMRAKFWCFLIGLLFYGSLFSGVRSEPDSSEAGEIPQQREERGRRSGCEVPNY